MIISRASLIVCLSLQRHHLPDPEDKIPTSTEKMATWLDQAVGMGLLSFAGMVFVYYTFWIIALPFVDEGQLIHQLFLARKYAVIIPFAIVGIALVCIANFIAFLTFFKKEKKS